MKLKRCIVDAVAALNASGALASELRLGAVAGPLAALDEDISLQLIAQLEAEAATVPDPTDWLKVAAKAAAEPEDEVEVQAEEEWEEPVPAPKVAKRPRAEKPTPAAAAAASGVEAKAGDWVCEACGDLQFARNNTCRMCGAPRPKASYTLNVGKPGGKAEGKAQGMKPGDWICDSCGDMNFARNVTCRKCGAERPPEVKGKGKGGKSGPEVKPGDWTCPSCGDHNFAKNERCRTCGRGRPAPGAGGAQMKPGDWLCPKCGDHNFARNSSCRSCGTARPEESWDETWEAEEAAPPAKKKKKAAEEDWEW